MPDALAPLIFPVFADVQVLTATSTYQQRFDAQPVQLTALGAGATRPASGQVYPRGDQ
jgi:hypothetical protein